MTQILNDQKKVLFISSMTEFGERYNFYMIQSLLIFLLIERFHFTQDTGYILVGTVISVVYISAIVGGYIADKLINHYIAAFIGSLLMLCGSAILAIFNSKNGLFLGLGFVSISTGLIKSNVATFIGEFYDKSKLSDSYRDFGFSIFYIGINLGAICALFFASYLKDIYGYSAPFYSSIIFAVLIIVNLLLGFFSLRKYIEIIRFNLKLTFKLIVIIGVYIALVFIILKNPLIANIMIFVAIFLCLVILYRSIQGIYYKNVVVALVFLGLSVLYVAIEFQMYLSILLFLEHIVSHHFFVISIRSSQFICILCLGIFILGPLLGKLWLYFGSRGRPIHDIDKFNIAFIFLFIAFGIFYLGIISGDLQDKVPAMAFVVGFFVLAASELCIMAIGLSFITKVAPKGFVSLYMGIQLVVYGIGGKIAGLLSTYVNITNNNYESRINMSHGLMLFLGLTSIGVIICFLIRKKIIAINLN